MTTKLTLPVGAAAITAGIEKHLKVRSKLDTELHVLACSALDHVSKHNDPSLLNKLVSGLSGNIRTNALRDWAVAHGNVVYDEKTKTLAYSKGKVADIPTAMAVPFWEFKPEAPYKPFDFSTELAKFIARAEKASMDTRNTVPSELLLRVRAAAQGGLTIQ